MTDKKVDRLYALLDAHNFKEAIKLAQEKDMENLDIVNALLVYAYVVTKQKADALVVARALIAKNCTDDHVLATLSQGLRMLKKDSELIPSYENMLKTHSFNEAGLLEIFQCYCRAGEHHKMQLVAQKLYKVTNKPCYMYWAVSSMVQQVIAAGTGSPKNMTLILAEKMLNKLIFQPVAPTATGTSVTSIHQPGAEEVQLYIDILMRLGKTEEALSAFLQLNPLVSLSTAPTQSSGKPTAAVSLIPPVALVDDRDFKQRASTIMLQELVAKSLYVTLCNQLLSAGVQPQLRETVRSVYEGIVYGEYPDQWDIHVKLIEQYHDCAKHYACSSEQERSVYYNTLINQHLKRLKQLQLAPTASPAPVASTASTAGGKKKKTAAVTAATVPLVASGASSSTFNTRYRGPYLAELHVYETLLTVSAFNDTPVTLQGTSTVVQSPRYLEKYHTTMKNNTSTVSEVNVLSVLSEINSVGVGIDASTTVDSVLHAKIKSLCQYICLFGDKQCLLGDIYSYSCSLGQPNQQSNPMISLFLRFIAAIAVDVEEKLLSITLETVHASAVTAAPSLKMKKGKGKEVDMQALYPPAVVLTEPELVNADRRVLATNLTCMMAKCQQIHHVVTTCLQQPQHASTDSVSALPLNQLTVSSNKNSAPWNQADRLSTVLTLYKHSLSLTLGGTGGEREVQSGDELLMLLSSQIQDSQSSMMNNSHTVELNELSREHYRGCLMWTELLRVGELTSPYNFVFHLERLEVARHTGAVMNAIASFNLCRVKHVQVESMSYVLLPCLLEYGFYTEAMLHNQSILHFHSAVGYDTGDQCNLAYKHSNYMKCLEMNRFIQLCKSSVQLALARVEVGCLQLVETLGHCDALLKYLEDFYTNQLLESQPVLSMDDINTRLHDNNFDYQIVTRLDIGHIHQLASPSPSNLDATSVVSMVKRAEAVEKQIRHRHMNQRVISGQTHMQIVYHLLKLSVDSVTVDQVATLSTDLAQLISNCKLSLESSVSSTVRWNQAIDVGSSSLGQSLDTFYHAAVELLTGVWTVIHSPSNISTTYVTALCNHFNDALSGLAAVSLRDKYCMNIDGSVVSAGYLRYLSSFVLRVCSWLPCLCMKTIQRVNDFKDVDLSSVAVSLTAFLDQLKCLVVDLTKDNGTMQQRIDNVTDMNPDVLDIIKSRNESCKRLLNIIIRKMGM